MRALLCAVASGLAFALAAPASAVTTFTGSTGQGQAFSNYQPSLVLSQLFATQGIFPSRGPEGLAANTLGMVRSFAGTYNAFGAPMAQGQTLMIAQNTALFSVLGTSFGGNGQTTYALPNLVGRTVIGTGTGQGLGSFDLGQMTGTDLTALTIANLPAHAHGLPGGGVTSTVGGSQPFDNYQPSLAMTYMIAVNSTFQGGPSSMLGAIGVFGGNFASAGWMRAEGQLLSVDDFSALFNIIGTTYGGDGQTTFALPDLRGRAIIGAGQGPGLGEIFLGEHLGDPLTTLTSAQMPAHDHDLEGGGTTDPAGGGLPVNNAQPSLGINYIINVQGIFPGQSGSGNISSEEPFIGEVIGYTGSIIPRGWALAHGQLLSIAQNQALFSIMGTTYGGNGQTTFALPDLRGRLLLGAGQGFQHGMAFGTMQNLLTEANLPAHVHSYEIGSDPIPEPATWAMMIGGFGLAGAAIRRRKEAAAFG